MEAKQNVGLAVSYSRWSLITKSKTRRTKDDEIVVAGSYFGRCWSALLKTYGYGVPHLEYCAFRIAYPYRITYSVASHSQSASYLSAYSLFIFSIFRLCIDLRPRLAISYARGRRGSEGLQSGFNRTFPHQPIP